MHFSLSISPLSLSSLCQNQRRSPDHSKMEQQNPQRRRTRGGLITMPFIIANEALEKVANYGIEPNMVFYLMKKYNMDVAKGANIMYIWNAASNFTPLVGAFLADSYLGRFLTIGLGSIFNLLGIILLWLTAMVPGLRPLSCDQAVQPCKSASPAQYMLLILSFALMSIGAGGVRSCSLAFGADQLENENNPKNERVIESFFSWYYAAYFVSVLIALTAMVYIQDHWGWKVGFGVPAILISLSALLFFLASRLYIKKKASKSLLTGFAQVMVVAYKNRKLAYPQQSLNSYHHKKDSEFTMPTNKLRFLNKACIIRNPQEVTSDGVAVNPWNLCTVEQVEELKALMKVIPIWSTGIMVSVNISQSSFPVLLASSMDRHVTSSFQIPAGSFVTFAMLAITIWVFFYERIILPLASKLKGRPVHLNTRVRMGIGIVFSCISMVISGAVEHIRRRKAIKQGFLDNPDGVVNMSATWLIPQYCVIGLAEAFNAISQTEFYYSEFPKSMSSIASSLFGLGMAVANLLASVIFNIVNNLTKGEGKESWVSSNINRGRYDKYYWVLAIMTFVNLLYYLLCIWAYGDSAEQVLENGVQENDLEEKSSRPGTSHSQKVLPA